MIRIQFNSIFLVCTFALLSQISARILFSFDTSEETSSSGSSSSSSSEEVSQSQLLKDAQQLKPDQQRILMKNFLNHLAALSEMQTDERKIEHDMLQDLTKIPYFENDAIATINKFRKVIEDGRKSLDQIIEKRKKTINAQDPDIVRQYESMWLQIESKKRDEAKTALENVDTILSNFAKSLKSTVGEQLKTLQSMQDIIGERKKTVDKDSEEIRKRIDAVKAATIKDDSTTTTPVPESISQLFLFDEKDVKEIREIYNFWMERLPKIDLPQSKHLLENIEKKGISLPLFCKSLAEMHVIGNKARECHKKGDKTGRDVLMKTLEQSNYKKIEEIMEDTPPPPIETIAKVVRERLFHL